MKIKIGHIIPNEKIFIFSEGNPKELKINDFLVNQKAIIFGLPGAFTSVCSARHLPGYVSLYHKFKAKGIDKIICISVNDPFVMNEWGQVHNVGNKIIMVADPFLNFTKSIGAEIDKSDRGLGMRSNRYSMFIDRLKVIKLEEEKDTSICKISAAENLLDLI